MQSHTITPVHTPVPPRREAILNVATRLFSEHGMQAVSTRQIAAAVGISQPSLYAHFPTKQALVSEVCVRAFQGLADRMQNISTDLAGDDRLRAMGHAYLEFGLNEPDAYRIAFMLDEPKRAGVEFPGPALGAGIACYTHHHRAIAEERGAGLSDHEVDVLAQSIWACLHGLVSLMIAKPEFPWVDRQELIDRHIDWILAASKLG